MGFVIKKINVLVKKDGWDFSAMKKNARKTVIITELVSTGNVYVNPD